MEEEIKNKDEKKEERKTKLKRIFSLIGVLLLVMMYAVTIVAAIFDNSGTLKFLFLSVAVTIVVPVIIWAINLFLK